MQKPWIGRDRHSTKAARSKARRLAFEAFEQRRVLAVFSVTSIDDAPVDTLASVGTLRQAIEDANRTGNIGSPDEIVFDLPAGSNTITLTEGELVVTDAVTIDGSGVNGTLGWENLTIGANGAGGLDGRVFRISDAAVSGPSTFRISDLSRVALRSQSG